LTIIAALLVAEALRAHFQLRRDMHLKPRRGRVERYPSLTVIRPIRGLDYGARKNIRAAFDHGYPGELETLFVFDDPGEPALPLVREAIGAHEAQGGRGAARVIFAGPLPAHRTGKLNAMIAGLREARGELIAFADSDIRPDRGAFTALVDTLLRTPGAGAAFAPVKVTEPPRTAGDAGYALLLNGLYGPTAAAIAGRNDNTLPFIMGQLMVLRREAIDAMGGLESAEGQLVDDMYMGARLLAAGYRNAVSPHYVPIIQRDLPLKDFLSIYLRWITFSRSGLPAWSFKLASWLRGMVFWFGLVVAGVALAFGAWAASALGLLAAAGVAASINRLHRRIGGGALGLRFAWVSFALLLVAPLVMVKILLRHEVRWRGRRYALDAGSRLAPAAPPQ
jgi:ceramide glucosyltransferase